jgi:stage II sporulation protein D
LYGNHAGEPVRIQILARSSSGRVKKLKIDNREISGETFRQNLNLPSTRFTVEKRKGQLRIICHGYGHGVGLCQYGADGMGRAQKSYKAILKTYYQDIDIYKMEY